jgi:hypothetical protein
MGEAKRKLTDAIVKKKLDDATKPGSRDTPERFTLLVAQLRSGARLQLTQKRIAHEALGERCEITNDEGIDGAARYLRNNHTGPLPPWLAADDWIKTFHRVAEDWPGLY